MFDVFGEWLIGRCREYYPKTTAVLAVLRAAALAAVFLWFWRH